MKNKADPTTLLLVPGFDDRSETPAPCSIDLVIGTATQSSEETLRFAK